MKLFVFFGLPGSGKTFAGEIAGEYFGYHVYDGDNDLTQEMLNAFQKQAVVTDAMRDVFFAKLRESVKKIALTHDKLVVCQTFIKEKYRLQFLKEFSQTEFVLLQTDTSLRENRLAQRKTMQLDKTYAQKMVRLFEKPLISHQTVYNNTEGNDLVKKQLEKILM